VAEEGVSTEDVVEEARPADEHLLRALADLDNLRKRYDRELDRERAAERARVALEWLPIIDNLERAVQHAEADPSAVFEGVRAVLEQAYAALGRLGFARFEDIGQPFDPTRHEAMGVVNGDAGSASTVAATVRPGYGNEEEVLRPAGVMVSRGSA
jgi:molecular chaperone GrpE